MSINSMNSRFAMAEKMSIPQIQQSVQSGSLPAYVGVPLLEQKMKEQQKAAAMAQLAQAQQQAQQFGIPSQTPIAQGIMDKASGIDDMPSNLPVAGYNDGGIVAFAEGGDAEDFDYEEYQDEQDAEEYNNMLRAYMAEAEAAGIEGIPVHRTKKVEMGVEKKAYGGIIGLNNGGILHYEGGGPVGDFLEPIDFGAELDRARQESSAANAALRGISPATNREDFEKARQAALKARQSENLLQGQYELNMANDPQTRPATYADVLRARPTMNGGRHIPPLPEIPYAPPEMPQAAPSAPAEAPQTSVNAETVDPEALGSEFGIQGILARQNAPAGGAGAGGAGGGGGGGGGTGIAGGSGPTRERPKSAFEEFIANIKEERAALNKQKQDDKYMALLTAGLGMMSGTSPNAFANIGQGAQAGVAQYGASAKQRAAERAALNKNLLMGQRYQSMEDIAGRTADINEARYRDTAARAAAGAGDAASLKQERLLNQREADLNRAIGIKTTAIQRQLETQFGKEGMYTNPNYQKEYNRLYRAGVAPLETQLNALYAQRSPDLFGPNSDFQAPQLAAPPEGVTVRKVK